MFVTVNREDFQTAVTRLQGPLTDKNVGHVGIKTEGNRLILTASDKILTIICEISSNTIRQGIVFLPGKLLTDVARELPVGEVTLESNESGVIVTAGEKSHFTMKLPQIKNLAWPVIDRPTQLSTAIVSAERFKYMIEQVLFTIATDSPHPYGGVGYLHKPTPQLVRLVGTDGFRLSYCEVNLDNLPDDFLKAGLCLSKRALLELQKICSEGFETVSLSISEDQKTFITEVPGYFVFHRLIKVNYPNYQGVIPTAPAQTISLPRASLQSMARRVLLAADKSKALNLNFEPETLTLASHTAGESEGKETLGIEDYNGPSCNLSLNGRYLHDIVSSTGSAQLLICFNTPDQPVMLAPAVEPIACKSKHVLVPMKETH